MPGPGTIWRAICRLAPMAVLAAAVSGGYPAPGLSWEVDARRFLGAADDAPGMPVPSAQAITDIERASVEIAAKVDRLRSAWKTYAAQQPQRERIEELDRELAQAIGAAERERRIQQQIGAWALFFQIVSDVYTVVEMAMEADAGTPGSPRGEEAGAEGENRWSDRRPASSGRPEDGLQGSEREHNGIVVVCDAGKCEAFRAGDLVDAALNSLPSSDSSQIRESGMKLRDTADESPPLGCWLESETCFPFSGPQEQISSAIDEAKGGKHGKFQTEAGSPISKKAAASLFLDFIEPIGRLKGAYEAISGRDPVTGEELTGLERILSAAGVVGGAPVKGTGKVLRFGKKGVNQGNKIRKAVNHKEFIEVLKKKAYTNDELKVLLNKKVYPRRKLKKLMEADGWDNFKDKGGHMHFKHRFKEGKVTIQSHVKDISGDDLQNVFKQAGWK